METVKDPAVLLGIGNTVAIVGLGLYFHKRQNVIENELEELSDELSELRISCASKSFM